METSIDILNLSKVYRGSSRKNESCALKDISLRVLSGEIFALIGPNGAGKSTLVKILLGIVHPTSGSAHILGRPVTDPSARESVGYLPENFHYPPSLTPRTFLHASGRLYGVPRADLSARVATLLDLVDMKASERIPFKKFSKGMLQRIGLAQALIHNPRVLFLDEPSDGLDPVGRRDFRELLKKLRDEGKTVFMNSHLLSEVEMVADRIAVIDKGSILRIGTLNDIVPPAGGYTITIRGALSDTLHDTLSLYPCTTLNDVTTVDVTSQRDLEKLLEIFKHEHVVVESFGPKKLTLEDSFLSLIAKEKRT